MNAVSDPSTVTQTSIPEGISDEADKIGHTAIGITTPTDSVAPNSHASTPVRHSAQFASTGIVGTAGSLLTSFYGSSPLYTFGGSCTTEQPGMFAPCIARHVAPNLNNAVTFPYVSQSNVMSTMLPNITSNSTFCNAALNTQPFTAYSSMHHPLTSVSAAGFSYQNFMPNHSMPFGAQPNPLHPYSSTLPATTDFNLTASHIASRQVLTRDLPTFSGRPEDWPIFITNYEQSTIRCGFSDQENLIRLQKCLKGPALEAVRGRLMVPSTVGLAISTLRMLYGRPDVIHQAMQRKLREEPAVQPNKLETLITFSLAVQNYRATMQAIGLTNYLNDPVLLNELVAKLPCSQRLSWGQRCLTPNCADIAAFDDWLFSLAMCASQVTSMQPSSSASGQVNTEIKKSVRESQKARVLVHEVMPSDKVICRKCGANHNLADCCEFVASSPSDRWKFIQENRLCLRCFKPHFIRRCVSKKCCGVDGCKMAHHSLLHTKTPEAVEKREQTALYHQPSNTADHEKQKTLFRYVKVTLHSNNKSVNTFALIDEGASCTLIETQLAQELNLEGPTGSLCLRWTNQITQSEVDSKFVSLYISPIDTPSQKYKLANARTVANLGLPLQSLQRDTFSNHAHLKGLPIQPYEGARAQILIGLDNVKIGVPIEIKEEIGSNLIAARCRLGWSVYGRNANDCAEHSLLHICECSASVEGRMDQEIKSYFAIESIGVYAPAKPLISNDDKRALKIMETTTHFLAEEKRWETGLLWKYDVFQLPDSLPMAIKRLSCLESKMKRDASLNRFLIDKIEDYERKGYIRKLGRDELGDSLRSWYLPIFTVLNTNKSKIRLVWDAAAKVNGTGLNDMLLKGPDLLKSLLGIFLRFRERPFAVCGDIREMFHQIRIVKEDQEAQKFLWRKGDKSRDFDVYVMQVMTFGASCSPTLANYVKNCNAERFSDHHPDAVQAITENTFVDDWLQSADSEDELARLATTVRCIHQEGGFEMRNWISNSERVMLALGADRAAGTKCFEEPETVMEKVLGMLWVPTSDELTFFEHFPEQTFDTNAIVSKRHILRTIMTIFDPLGLLGFVIIQAKIILQDVWRSGVSWDEPIKEDEHSSWFQWVKRIRSINGVRIPRCIWVCKSKSTQIHIFVDASLKAYAAIAYMRSEVDTQICCTLIASKTRVAPLKPISVPRLELLAAVLGLRLANFICSELSIKVSRRFFWSDSKNVLFWLRSDTRKFNQFVALRVGEILEGSDIKEWRWLPSHDNIADEGTKWHHNRDFDDNHRWFSGPKFLLENERDWPVRQFSDDDDDTVDTLHHTADNSITPFQISAITPDPIRFSSWKKLRATQMFVLRFIRSITKRRQCSQALQGLLNMNELDAAELALMLSCQGEVFREEINQLNDCRQVNRKSPLFKFSPYLDQTGLLRVKGRIDAIDGIGINVKRPIILPRNHHVTRLIAGFYHLKFHHHFNEIVVNEMRQKYCIPALRRLVKECAAKCQSCRNRKASPQPPQMGDLPVERLSPFTRPFAFTGVDYFGPIDVVVGRRNEKRWCALFTCLTTRAVNIEISSSLSTESFLLIFKQFVSRRGVPKRMVSDNGTNFRGASRLLVEEIEKISSEDLERKHPDIEWVFIPPASPHMGGTWERMVRSTKSILMDILPGAGLREEVLRAVLADVENILNSRPLTYVPIESTDQEALTPNHFLIGCSSGIREKANYDDSGSALLRNYRISSQLADQFWKRWVREYLPCLTRRTKWYRSPPDPIKLNDIVIIVDENSKRNTWPKGVVTDLHFGKDGLARSAVVKTVTGLCTRPIVKLAKLDIAAE